MSGNKRPGSLDALVTPQPKLDQIWNQYRNAKEFSIEEESVASIKENEENVDPKSPTKVALVDSGQVRPSPRKINMEKIEACDRKYRSRSPLNLDEFKTPPRRILQGKPEDADSSKENSIIDVGNDQMFENSIFTEYDDKNLSCMSAKMTKKWRKKWEKEDMTKNTFSTNTIEKLVAKQEQLEVTNARENLKKEWTAKDNSFAADDPQELNEPDNDNNASTCSEWFNTTRDEMVLYEKFGEDYDEVVNKMTHEEKVRLKNELDGIDEKPEEESQVKPEAVETKPVPKPRTLTPVKADIAHHHANTYTAKYFKSPHSLQATPNYLRPTTASKMRTSPRKTPSSPKFNLDVTPCPRGGVPSPSSAPKHRKILHFFQWFLLSNPFSI